MNREKRPDGDRPPDEDPNERYRQLFKRSWIWILLAVLIFFAYRLFINPPSSASNLLGLNQVADYVRNGSVQRIVVQGDDIIVEISETERRRSRKESGESLLDSLKTFGVTAGSAVRHSNRRGARAQQRRLLQLAESCSCR